MTETEQQVTKLVRDQDRLWNEHKLVQVKQSQFEATVNSISKELHEMKDNETKKAVERQKTHSIIERLEEKVDDLSDGLKAHIIDEMEVYGKLKKYMTIMGVAIIAIVLDNQTGSNIVGTLIKWFIGG